MWKCQVLATSKAALFPFLCKNPDGPSAQGPELYSCWQSRLGGLASIIHLFHFSLCENFLRHEDKRYLIIYVSSTVKSDCPRFSLTVPFWSNNFLRLLSYEGVDINGENTNFLRCVLFPIPVPNFWWQILSVWAVSLAVIHRALLTLPLF